MLSTYVVTNSGDSGTDSLRWAIEQANASGSASVIDFNFGTSGPVKIQLASPLPSISVPVMVDGTTQPGYSGTPLVELDGSQLTGGGNDGLVLTAGGSTVRGLAIGGFSDSAIVLEAQGGNAIASDYLGLDPSGVTAIPNGCGLTILGSSNNTIGLSLAGGGNVISGNSSDGILVDDGGTGATQNLIAGNLIGTDASGLVAVGNGHAGIEIDGIRSGGNTVGGAGGAFGNVISGNDGPGIEVGDGAAGTAIQANVIGLAGDGKTPLGNQGDGILLDDAPQTMVGGTDVGEGNVISANQDNGIETASNTEGLWVAGNFIGTDATGQLALGNIENGIALATSSNLIGGTAAGAANIIEYNGTGRVGAGVQLIGQVVQDTILSNSIYANDGLGINLGSGPTPNHAPGTAGPNNYQNYPSLSSAKSDGSSLSVAGSLYDAPNTGYVVQFFSSPQADRSGFGQGKTLVGQMSVETDAQGNASFNTTLPGSIPAGGALAATATDAFGNTSEFSADLLIQGQMHLVVSGSATPDPVLAGSDVTYTIDVANKGLADAHSVMLNDQLPVGVSVVSVTPSQGFVVPEMTGGTVSVDLGTIAAGASATVTLVVQTGAGSAGTIVDKAGATCQESDPNNPSPSAAIPVVVETNADVSVSLAESPSPALAGGELTYTMTVANHGPDGAPAVVATMPMAAGLSLVSANSDLGNVALSNGQVVAALGDMASGSQAVVTIVLRTTAAGTVTETATVTSDTINPNPADETSSVTTTVEPAADLAVGVSAGSLIAATGIALDYTLTVTNTGPSDASGVILTDSLPTGATFVTATDGQGNTPATLNDGVLAWPIGALADGETATLVVAVVPTAQPGSTLVDSASVTGGQADPISANNTATLSVPVRGVSDLSVAAALQSVAAYVGQPMTYVISVTNQGPANELDAVLSSSLPAGLTVVSTRSTQGPTPSVSQGILTANLGPLASGASAQVTLVVTPGTTDVGVVTTGFSVQGQDYDPNLSDNAAVVTASVAASADLGVSIQPGAGPAVAQVAWSYTVQVNNAGPSQATGVLATIPIPAGVALVSATSSQGLPPVIQQDGGLAADLGVIDSGAAATITVTVDPTPAVSGSAVSLSAGVVGNEYDPAEANNQAVIEVSVAPSVDVGMSLAATPQVVPSGQVVTFDATVKNAGPTTATGVVVTFPPVSGLAFLSAAPSQGAVPAASGLYFARIGTLAPGASATVSLSALATASGNYVQSASVSEDQYNINLPAASATAVAQVQPSAGVVEFGVPGVEVTDKAGAAVLPVVRLYGSAGTVTIHYQTVALNATPGMDFTPMSGTLTLGPGQTVGSIVVPILDDPYKNHDELVNVVLDSPTGGAFLGAAGTAQIHIQNVAPDFTPPQVTGLSWSGWAGAISSLTLGFSAPLDPAYATSAADYRLIDAATGRGLAIASITYNPANFSVTVVPQAPIPSGHYDEIQVVGAGPGGIRDLAGNLLDGTGTGAPGSNYAALFAQGKQLSYVDNGGNRVKLRLKGMGYLEQVLTSYGEGVTLNLVGMIPHRTTLTGKILHRRGGTGQTMLGTIGGLGQFGDVKILLNTPPFRVTQLPFQRRGRYVL
ncbi:MAG: Calx-beta domain-containing protein [Isosphaeraceae bacterium]